MLTIRYVTSGKTVSVMLKWEKCIEGFDMPVRYLIDKKALPDHEQFS